MEGKPDRAAEALEHVLELFGRDDAPAVIAHSTIAAMADDRPSSSWSLGNRVLMMLAGTADARGFKQWKDAGRSVKKGSKAFYILGPSTRKVTERDAVTGDEAARVIVTGFHAIPVFRYEDTEGEPIDYPEYAPPAMPPLFDVAERFGVTVRWLPYSDRYLGFYRPGSDEIILATHDVKVFFHELAHAAHKRVAGTLKGGQQAGQEIVAETVAAVLAVLYDVDVQHVGWAREYVSSYGNGDAARAAVKQLAAIQKTLALILETAGDRETELAAA